MITVSESGITRDADLNQHWMPALNTAVKTAAAAL